MHQQPRAVPRALAGALVLAVLGRDGGLVKPVILLWAGFVVGIVGSAGAVGVVSLLDARTERLRLECQQLLDGHTIVPPVWPPPGTPEAVPKPMDDSPNDWITMDPETNYTTPLCDGSRLVGHNMGVQGELYRAWHRSLSVNGFMADVGQWLLGGVVVLLVSPWVWYFLLQRLKELALALQGK